jgi:signal transduction histidine kinase
MTGSPFATTAAYLAPPAVATISACLVMLSSAGTAALAGGMVLAGLTAGALAGRAASAAERRAVVRGYEERLDDLDHDLRAPMTIIRGEVELVLSDEKVSAGERQRSSDTIIEQLERLERRLRQRYRP